MPAPTYAYVILLEFVPAGGGEPVRAESRQEAYTIHDAVTQAMYEVNGQHGYVDAGCTMRVLAVRPDSERAASVFQAVLDSLALLRAPTGGRQ